MLSPAHKTVLVTGANGYIGNAVARAFVRAGWKTYGLVRDASTVSSLVTSEIIPLLGSPSSPTFLTSLNEQKVVFDVIVSTTEQIMDYIIHYNDIISLLRTLATSSNAAGIKTLVMFTSGCKDYGMMNLGPNGELVEHTEETPLNPPPFAVNRANYAIKIFEHKDLFDAVLLRPTNVYGLSSSFYGLFFSIAAEAKERGFLEVREDRKTVLHAMHVEDCAEAYVSLAEAERGVVRGQCYNISASRYETLEDIANALVKEYGIEGGVKYVKPENAEGNTPDVVFERMLMGFSQWVGNGKLKEHTGWKDRRLLFSEGVGVYRRAFEGFVQMGHKGPRTSVLRK